MAGAMNRIRRIERVGTMGLAAAAALSISGCQGWRIASWHGLWSRPDAHKVAVTQYIDSADLDRGTVPVEALDIAFLIHPRCPYGGDFRDTGADAARARLFRYIAANVLSEVFRRAVETRTERELLEIERQRGLVLTTGKEPLWFLDPAALFLVDLREGREPGAPGLLCVRLLDLKLARLLGTTQADLERQLYNRRALVAEAYRELESRGGDGVTSEELVSAWRDVLKELLGSWRYTTYRAALVHLESGGAVEHSPVAKEELELLFFASVPESSRPYNATQRAAGFEDRAAALEARLFFGRRPAGAHTGTPVAASSTDSTDPNVTVREEP